MAVRRTFASRHEPYAVTVAPSIVPLPSGPAYTVVLICHVAAVLTGMATIVAGAVAAAGLVTARDGPLRPSVRSYFSPGANWAGRVLYLVPVFGVALLAMSGGAYRLGSTWVLAGIGLWAAGMALAEGVLWPAERRVRRALAVEAAGGGNGPPSVLPAAVQAARVVCVSSAAVLGILVAAMVVMVAKP